MRIGAESPGDVRCRRGPDTVTPLNRVVPNDDRPGDLLKASYAAAAGSLTLQVDADGLRGAGTHVRRRKVGTFPDGGRVLRAVWRHRWRHPSRVRPNDDLRPVRIFGSPEPAAGQR
jgi:hypothetical protein